MWAHVRKRFRTFLSNLALTDAQRADGMTRHAGVRDCLNRHYFNVSSGYANSLLVGSWGKSTEIRPPRDIDVLFSLPPDVYQQYEARPIGSNKQSALLQGVKRVLANKYSSTKIRGDGQVVVVPFASYAVEVVPSFKLSSGRYWICDTHNDGRYVETDPEAEKTAVLVSETMSNGDARPMIRMAKCWQAACNVPLSSFQVELIAMDFLQNWAYRGKGLFWYDWAIRDFFTYLLSQENRWVFAPGTFKMIDLGQAWVSRARSASGRAQKACAAEHADNNVDAGWEWQKIFGDQIPLIV